MVSIESRDAMIHRMNQSNGGIMSAQQNQQRHHLQLLAECRMHLAARGGYFRAHGTLLMVLFLAATGMAQPQSPAGVVGPRIQFATPVYDFGKMKNGETVKYSYVFTNIGDRLLEVSNVHASCGCTTSGEYSRQVEPGKTGNIPIQFSSGSFHGDVTKMITVTCNDATQPTVMLQLKAHIWKPVEIIPQFAALQVTMESPLNTTTVRIVNNEETPLMLSAPQSSNPAFAAELKTTQPGKEYELVVRTVPPLPTGTVQGQISMKSSSTNLPVVNITAWANVQPSVMVTPAQIVLPATPLANLKPYTILIRNNATNSLVLTDPTVNAQGVEVHLKEFQPGRYFSLTVTFPAGFEIAPGDSIELSLKSNHPQFPVIKVPIQQSPRPTPTAASGQFFLPLTPPVVPQQR
jgi:hypothetical protein